MTALYDAYYIFILLSDRISLFITIPLVFTHNNIFQKKVYLIYSELLNHKYLQYSIPTLIRLSSPSDRTYLMFS